MDLIRTAINKPVTVVVGVILLVMFGLIGLSSIPVQLTPTVDRPVITVTTSWPGRSPEEIVDEITQEQEKRLKNVPNLRAMRSTTTEGQAEISLEFYIGAEIARALQEVSDALRQVPEYPAEVDEPIIKATEGQAQNAIAWLIVDLDAEGRARFPGFDVATLFDPVDKEVRPYLERIDGVAEVNVYGGREREVQVLLDLTRLAQRNLNPLEVIEALRAENRNTSAGTISEGKRDYRVRVLGQFVTEEDVLNTVIAYRPPPGDAGGVPRPVYVRDVGTAEFGHAKKRGFVRSLGNPCIAMPVIRQVNGNTMTIMADLRERLKEVQRDILPRLDPEKGRYLRIQQVYDETVYIQSAIDLVKDNLLEGGLLAALVLLIFLRSFVTTGMVAIAIPLSVIGAFIVLLFLGRTLNVVSLAGLAFSVGMGIDNAIVVLENIYRRRQLGDSPAEAAYRGAREVWGAILASTLTNVAVFVPVITIQEEAGQLFRDISIAATASVFISLLVAITVIPTAAARWMGLTKPPERHGRFRTAWEDLFGLATLAARVTARFARGMRFLMTGWRAWTVRPAIIAVMTLASLVGARLLAPPLDYLPAGNQNLVFGFLLIPPGYSVEHQLRVAERVESVVLPYSRVDPDKPEEVAKLPPIFNLQRPTEPFPPVPVANFFAVGFNGGMFAGATSKDPDRVIPIANLVTGAMNTSPDAMGFAAQTSIFGMGLSSGNAINLEISGPDIKRVVAAAQFMQMEGMKRYGYVRPDPANFNLFQPELQVRLNQHGRELGLTTRDAGIAARALFDGAFIDDFRLGSDTVDMVLLPSGGRLDFKEQMATVPVVTPTGRTVPLDSVIEVVEAPANQQIRRIEELPSVTLVVTPPSDQPLESVMETLRTEVVEPARRAGLIDQSMAVRLEGSAAKLDEVRAALFGKADPGRALSRGQKAGLGVAGVFALAGVGVALFAIARAVRRGRGSSLYAAAGALGAGLIVAALVGGAAWQPQLMTARFIWALLVTYLLMCSLYESFAYPLVIMFSVPLAVVGGFAGLAITHHYTLADPTKAAQQLDVLTMLGFVILIGIVVNNAILLVEQALNMMEPWRLGEVAKDEAPLAPIDAITESIRTRVRPIFMSALTSVFGTLPLVLYPGAGSEMYRGMGAVLIGGQLVSTVFTLALVPLVFSLVVDMRDGLREVFGGETAGRSRPTLVPVPAEGIASNGHTNGQATHTRTIASKS